MNRDKTATGDNMIGIHTYDIPAGIGDGLFLLGGAAAAVFVAVIYFNEIADGVGSVMRFLTPWRSGF
jgi:hypothetical protein